MTVHVPPDPPEVVVFAGDGQVISQWGGFLEAAGVPSTMIVGVHGLADETSRLHEYSPVFDAERFAAHEKFFVTGADVVMSERVASHGAALWQGEFPLMVAWAFGRGSAAVHPAASSGAGGGRRHVRDAEGGLERE